MSSLSTLYINNDCAIRLNGLVNGLGAFLNDATVTLETIIDEATGIEVTGATFPLAMTYVAASDGDYEGVIPYTLAVDESRGYLATVQAIALSGRRAEWVERLRVKVRRV